MAKENVSQVKEMITDKNSCFDDAKPVEIAEETNGVIVDLPSAALSNRSVSLRRYSTGVLDKRGGLSKDHVQTRYRGNTKSSTDDVCKHGKRREDDVVIKPWTLVKKSGDLGVTTRRTSLGNVSKPEKSLQGAKRDIVASEIVKSCDGSRVKRSETKSPTTTMNDSAVVRKVKKTNLDVKKTNLDVKKSNIDVKKVSRIDENKSCKERLLKSDEKKKKKIGEVAKYEDVLEKNVSRTSEKKKEDLLKNFKNNEKSKIGESVGCGNVLEKTLYVVESISIEEKKQRKKSEIQQSSKKKILRGSGKKSPILLPSFSPSLEEVKEPRIKRSESKLVEQTTSMSKNLVTKSKTESKITPKRISLKATRPPPLGPPTKPLSFKKGKVLEPKQEDSTPRFIKYKKRVIQEPSDENKKKKNLLVKGEGVGKIKILSGEGKGEIVVLKHRKVEAKKKLQTLFNNVIEETVTKLEEVRKSKVQALVGAFETVISLLDDNTKTSHKKKIHGKSASSQVVQG